MKHFVYSFLLLFFVSNTTFAQKVKFSGGVSVGMVMDYSDSYTNTFKGKSNKYLPDSLVEVSLVTREFHENTTYTSKMQFAVSGGVDFRMSKKLEINTGLTFSYFDFDGKRKQSFKILNEEVIDTIPGSLQPLTQIGCDSSVFLPTGERSGPEFGMLSLQIPLAFKYEPFDGFKVILGGQMSTPIFTRQSSYRLNTEKKVENGKVICITTTEEYENHSGNGFQNLRLGILGGASYKIFPKMEVNLLAEKSIGDVFFSERSVLRTGNAPFKPVSLRLGINYLFGASENLN